MKDFFAELRANGLVMRISAIAAIGGFLFGYDTGVISGAVLYIKKDFGIGSTLQEFVVSGILVGAIVGALISGYLADRISRRNTKIISGTVYVFAAVGCALSVNAPMLIGFRFLLGIAVGTASFVSPMYISEVAPPKIRGALTSFNQLAVTSGIFLSYIVDWALKGATYNWRWMLGIAVIPGAALAVGMLTVPKTPRWLMEQGREDEAREVLERLRRGSQDADVDAEIDGIRETADRARNSKVKDLLAARMRPLLVVGVGLALFQQFVGVNTVIYYAPTILQQTGLGAGSAITQALAVGATNVVFTIVAVLLLDRVGRRPLLITGTCVLTASLALLAVYFGVPALQSSVPWLALIALVTYIAGFAIGLGPVFWLMISEIFPQGLRSKAMSVATTANWGANLLIAATFLTLTNVITRSGTFALYTAIAIGAIVFFAFKVPETKGRTLEDIQSELAPETAGGGSGADAAGGGDTRDEGGSTERQGGERVAAGGSRHSEGRRA